MFIYISEGMYFIQSFFIQPRSLAYLLGTMEREMEEDINISQYVDSNGSRGPLVTVSG